MLGCSGGLDSLLLLYVLSALYAERLQVVYINHQLQADSSIWGNQVAQHCQNLNIPFSQYDVHVAQGNTEQQARIARLNVFQQVLNDDDVLILAHHQQDQAETFLLRLFSGAGVQGLQAMKMLEKQSFYLLPQTKKTSYFLWRPLLNISREQIQQWVSQLQLDYIDDPMNADEHYDRVWCRQRLWGVIRQRFPQMQQAIYRSSLLMQDANDIIQQVLQQDLAQCVQENRLNIEQWQSLIPARKRALLSEWMKGRDEYRPSLDMVERLQDEVIFSRDDAQAMLHYQGHIYVRFQQYLYRYTQSAFEQFQYPVMEQSVVLASASVFTWLNGQFSVEMHAKKGLHHALLQQRLTLRNYQTGMKIRLYGRQGARTLKKLAQEYSIAWWLRKQIQFLYIDDIMLAVLLNNGQHQFLLCQSDYVQDHGWLLK